MKIRILAFVLLCATLGAFAQDKEGRSPEEFLHGSEGNSGDARYKGIPHDLLNKAGVRNHLSVGAESCIYCWRQLRPAASSPAALGEGHNGAWSAPAICLRLKAAVSACKSAARATDFVLLVMNDSGRQIPSLSSKVKLGADASVAAGPVGRDASAGNGYRDESGKNSLYIRRGARGVFWQACRSKAPRWRSDDGANKVALYGKELSAKADRSRRSRENPRRGTFPDSPARQSFSAYHAKNKAQAFPALTTAGARAAILSNR